MIIACEECGKQYRVDLDQIKGRSGTFSCQSCKHRIVVHKPNYGQTIDPATSDLVKVLPDAKAGKHEKRFSEPTKPPSSGIGSKFAWRLGLRVRMLVLFFVLPGLVMASATFFLLHQVERLSNLITDNSMQLSTDMAEEAIAEKARAVGEQVRIYLEHHPDWKLEELNKDPQIQKIALQKVGKTGYTVLFRIATDDLPMAMWVHPNEDVIGIPLDALGKKLLGKEYPAFHKIIAPGLKGDRTPHGGYYNWVEKDGSKRAKYLYNTPIGDSVLGIAATTYIDEFTQPMLDMKHQAQRISQETRWINIMIVGGSLLIFGLIVVGYSYGLSGRIAALTTIADKISLGELDVEIETKTKDEIGDMAEAILRMKDSIEISMERLRRRRLRN
jgi:predicted Zn finger-like uncharacterized protein